MLSVDWLLNDSSHLWWSQNRWFMSCKMTPNSLKRLHWLPVITWPHVSCFLTGHPYSSQQCSVVTWHNLHFFKKNQFFFSSVQMNGFTLTTAACICLANPPLPKIVKSLPVTQVPWFMILIFYDWISSPNCICKLRTTLFPPK